MRQVNFLLIFGFGLTTVFFTLQNTDPTSVHIFPGLSTSMPLAALLLLVAGVGAMFAWFFAGWSGILAGSTSRELEISQQRIEQLENDLTKSRKGFKVLSFMNQQKDSEDDSIAA